MWTRTEAIVGSDGGIYARLLPLHPWDCSHHRLAQTENWVCNEGEQDRLGLLKTTGTYVCLSVSSLEDVGDL